MKEQKDELSLTFGIEMLARLSEQRSAHRAHYVTSRHRYVVFT